ncbi:hypothetical protein EDB83DRAFT_1270371 [Lactarius deliciosus]|nr:hypothetical protein EDB83DRAFT_1270371 [Lactarius deliciosus]
MTDVIVKIMVEVLSILGILTKEIGQGRMKKYLKELVGKKDVKDAVERLDKLTQEEAGMAAIEALKIGRGIGDIVKDIDAKAEHIDERVQVVRVKVEEVDEKVQSVDNKVQGVDHKVDSVIEGIKETGVAIRQVASLNRSGKRKDLQGWISPPDPSVNYNTACRAHHRGTAAWCTQGDTFVDWKASGSLLWIHGKPGSGKTILSSVIIRDIKSLSNARPGSAYMAYFFFDFKDTGKQGSRALLSSILVQLSNRSERCCDVLHELYSAHQNGAEQPTDNSLMQCLKDMLTIAEQVPIYLIMDALDECPNDSGMPSSRETVLELVEELVRLGRSNLRLCVTSRLEFDIRTALEPLAVHQVSLSDESGQKQDIIDYVTFVVCSDRRMKRWRDDDKDAGHRDSHQESKWNWVFCHLEVLRHCFPNDVHRVLEELPESLDKTYERILKQIPKANRRHAYRLLQCIMTAIQPLRVEELAEVLALDFSTGAIPSLNTDWRWEDQEEAVLSACSSLVTVIVNNGSRVVQFSHFSVQEFLASDRLASSIDEVSHFHILLGPSHAMFVQGLSRRLSSLGRPLPTTAVSSRFPLLDMLLEIGFCMPISGVRNYTS